MGLQQKIKYYANLRGNLCL